MDTRPINTSLPPSLEHHHDTSKCLAHATLVEDARPLPIAAEDPLDAPHPADATQGERDARYDADQ